MTRTQRVVLWLMDKTDASLHILFAPGSRRKGHVWLGLDQSRWVQSDALRPTSATLRRLKSEGLITKVRKSLSGGEAYEINLEGRKVAAGIDNPKLDWMRRLPMKGDRRITIVEEEGEEDSESKAPTPRTSAKVESKTKEKEMPRENFADGRPTIKLRGTKLGDKMYAEKEKGAPNQIRRQVFDVKGDIGKSKVRGQLVELERDKKTGTWSITKIVGAIEPDAKKKTPAKKTPAKKAAAKKKAPAKKKAAAKKPAVTKGSSKSKRQQEAEQEIKDAAATK